jgi:hypothetical protein
MKGDLVTPRALAPVHCLLKADQGLRLLINARAKPGRSSGGTRVSPNCNTSNQFICITRPEELNSNQQRYRCLMP